MLGHSSAARFLKLKHLTIDPRVHFPHWDIGSSCLAAITWMGSLAASAKNKIVAAVLLFLAGGSTLAAIGELAGSDGLRMIAGYLFIISAILAWYAASAMMLEGAFHRRVLLIGKANREAALVSGVGEPGVIRGQ